MPTAPHTIVAVTNLRTIASSYRTVSLDIAPDPRNPRACAGRPGALRFANHLRSAAARPHRLRVASDRRGEPRRAAVAGAVVVAVEHHADVADQQSPEIGRAQRGRARIV